MKSEAEVDPSLQWGSREHWRILKNIGVVSIAFMVHYSAWQGTANLQSSINVEAGVGMASQAAMYTTVLITSLFMAVVILKWLGTKWTMMCGFASFMPYIVAQLHPTFYTLIPAAILAGLGFAPLWCAVCTYISIVSEAHSKITKTPVDVYIARHFGQFYMLFHISQVWGNTIYSAVLLSGDNIAAVTSINSSMIPEMCGANFLPSADAGKALLPQPPEKIQTLVGISLAFMAGAMLIVGLFLDPSGRYKRESKDTEADKESSLSSLFQTMKLIVEPNQLLIMVSAIFLGLQVSFVSADITVSFVSCAIGPGTVGYMMMVYGVADACGCYITGFLIRWGRVRLVCCAMVVNTGLFIAMLMYRPQAGEVTVPYLIAIVAGLCDAVWLVHSNTYYGIVFPGREEPAYASFRLFESMGFMITFAVSPYLRTRSKIYTIFITMCVGGAGYFISEYRRRKTNRTFEITKDNVFEKVKGYDNKAYQS